MGIILTVSGGVVVDERAVTTGTYGAAIAPVIAVVMVVNPINTANTQLLIFFIVL